ncbi:MAG: hypothetical protein L6455_11105, partial [Kiritimatiellae bacterium]|nr:hypothetical protein [Kiritimatiellia bacterium]
VTNVISKVLVGTIGDFAPMTDQSDTGPSLAGLTNWPTPGDPSNDVKYTANFTAYYDLGLPALWIQPLLTNVCINSSNVTFWLTTNSYVTNGVTWSLTPEGLSNGAALTDYASNAVVNVGGVATTYVVRATANENTNIYGSAALNVVKAGSPLQYKIGANAWADMPDPLYVSKDTTVEFKAVKVPINVGWPSGKPVWGGVVSGSGKETNSYTFATLSMNGTDYKLAMAECGNTVTGQVLIGGIRKIPLGESTNLVKGIIGKVYIPTKWGGSNTLFGANIELFYADGADLDPQTAIEITNGELDGNRVAQGNPCEYEIPSLNFGWYYVKITNESDQTISSTFYEHGEVTRPWQGYYWSLDSNTPPNLYQDGYALDKYDQVYGTTSQVWEAANHVSSNPGDGHCPGLAVASVLISQPTIFTTNGVSFTQDDMEGLYTELADSYFIFYVDYSVTNIPAIPLTAATGEAVDAYCDNFQYVLRTVIKEEQKALVSNLRDATGSDENAVWFHAVYKYRSQFIEAPDLNDPVIVRVYTTLWSPVNTTHPSTGTQDRTDNYTYDIKFSSSGEIDGQWSGQNWRTASGFAPESLRWVYASSWTSDNSEVTKTNVDALGQ